jgi:hypothetical protein
VQNDLTRDLPPRFSFAAWAGRICQSSNSKIGSCVLLRRRLCGRFRFCGCRDRDRAVREDTNVAQSVGERHAVGARAHDERGAAKRARPRDRARHRAVAVGNSRVDHFVEQDTVGDRLTARSGEGELARVGRDCAEHRAAHEHAARSLELGSDGLPVSVVISREKVRGPRRDV